MPKAGSRYAALGIAEGTSRAYNKLVVKNDDYSA